MTCYPNPPFRNPNRNWIGWLDEMLSEDRDLLMLKDGKAHLQVHFWCREAQTLNLIRRQALCAINCPPAKLGRGVSEGLSSETRSVDSVTVGTSTEEETDDSEGEIVDIDARQLAWTKAAEDWQGLCEDLDEAEKVGPGEVKPAFFDC